MPDIEITERGWPGHFCAASHCLFRRNTLLTYKDKRIVVSTVGNYKPPSFTNEKPKFEKIGVDRFFETMAFEASLQEEYWDADVQKDIHFESNWAISEQYPGVDNDADIMHDNVVKEIADKLKKRLL